MPEWFHKSRHTDENISDLSPKKKRKKVCCMISLLGHFRFENIHSMIRWSSFYFKFHRILFSFPFLQVQRSNEVQRWMEKQPQKFELSLTWRAACLVVLSCSVISDIRFSLCLWLLEPFSSLFQLTLDEQGGSSNRPKAPGPCLNIFFNLFPVDRFST